MNLNTLIITKGTQVLVCKVKIKLIVGRTLTFQDLEFQRWKITYIFLASFLPPLSMFSLSIIWSEEQSACRGKECIWKKISNCLGLKQCASTFYSFIRVHE